MENKLDKAIIRYNESMSLKKIYEDIVKALQQEKLTFDTRLVQFERSLKSKKADASELESISRDANKAKEFARAELAKLEQQMSDEKRSREKEIQQRRELIRSKKQVDEPKKVKKKRENLIKRGELLQHKCEGAPTAKMLGNSYSKNARELLQQKC